jgi:hypothetical protein
MSVPQGMWVKTPIVTPRATIAWAAKAISAWNSPEIIPEIILKTKQ